MDDGTSTKRCTACGLVKPLDEFHLNRQCVGGRATSCKECSKVRVKQARDRKRAAMGEEAWKQHQRDLVARRLSRAVDDALYRRQYHNWLRSGVTEIVASVLAAEDAETLGRTAVA